MADERRTPIFIRVPPGLKEEVAEAAWLARISVSHFAENALRDKLKSMKGNAEPVE